MLSHLLQENLGGIVCIIISGIILYYIYRSPVKSYFGRGSSPALSATTQALRICYRDLLRRVNDIGKSLALQKMNKACKQLNPLSLDLGLYLSDCRIPDEAYSLQFYFLSMDSFKRFALVQDFYRSIHSLGSPSIAFRAVEKHNPQDSNRYLQFFTWIFQ